MNTKSLDRILSTLLSLFFVISITEILNSVPVFFKKTPQSELAIAQYFLFIVFFILFRFKVYMEDIFYVNNFFSKNNRSEKKCKELKINLFLGWFFWVLWIASANLIATNYFGACILLFVGLFFASLALLASDICENLRYIIFNFFYMMFFVLSACSQGKLGSIVFLCCALILVVFDIMSSSLSNCIDKILMSKMHSK